MITIKKLASLPETTRLRKCARILDDGSWNLRHGETEDNSYLAEVCRLVIASTDPRVSGSTRHACMRAMTGTDWRSVADVAISLEQDLALERADWDFRDPFAGSLDGTNRDLKPFTVVLDRIRSPFNIGSLFRTADSFGVSAMLLVSPGASAAHPRARCSAMGCTETVAHQEVSEQKVLGLLHDVPLFALELGGDDVQAFPFPDHGAVIIGSEELGVSPRLLEAADQSLGRVSIPLFGSKGSLNVSVAFGILMHRWYTVVERKP